MTSSKGWFALAAGIAIALATGCSRHAGGSDANGNGASDRSANANVFVASANRLLEDDAAAMQRATTAARSASDAATQKLVTGAEGKHLELLDRLIEGSTRFDLQNMEPETARAIERLRLWSAIPIPNDPAKLSELASLAVRMRWTDAVASYCKDGNTSSCRSLADLDAVLRDSRDFDERRDAWSIRQANTVTMRKDYARFVALANEGTKRLGFANAGEYERSRYDLDADELRTQTDRLWSQIKPLYDQLQCHVRMRLMKQYGDRAQDDGMIRAHLIGGLGPADWNSQWNLLASGPDITQPANEASPAIMAAAQPKPASDKAQPFLLRPREDDPLATALVAIESMRRASGSTNPGSGSISLGNDGQATIDAQMRVALDVFAKLAFAMASEHWRWGVFDGSIKPGDYNKAWWAMRAKYEGIAPPAPRDERTFDAGATYAIAANDPQTGAFLAGFLQFQIGRALCRAARADSQYGCDFARDATAGKHYRAMLERGASQPWQKTLKEFTGDDTVDADALLEYFKPLRAWLDSQNRGEACGWEGNFASGAPSSSSDVPP